MPAPTITQIITQIAPISEVLASNDVANGALFGPPINPMWPLQIYIETQTCLWRYTEEGIDSGAIPSQRLVNNTNYLYSIICGKYGQIAQSLINAGGVIPVPSGGTTIARLPYIGIAGRGITDNDPDVGASTVQSSKLIGLGGDRVELQIFVNTFPMQNFGNNPNFIYYPLTGILDLSPLILALDDSIYVDRNQ